MRSRSALLRDPNTWNCAGNDWAFGAGGQGRLRPHPYLADEGIKVVGGLTYESVRRTENGVALTVVRDGRPETLAAEQILVATGRAPNTESLGLAEAEIARTPADTIVVDDRMRTSKVGVYVAGDVTGKDQFVYMAAYGAKLAAKNALNGDSLRYDNSAMPAVVFTDPQVCNPPKKPREF